MEIKIMAFSLNKYDIPAEIKKEIMEMYSNESDAMESQIKDLSKKMKSFSDYEDLKTKTANYEAEIEKIKNESKEQLLNTKKQYAYDNAIKSSNVSNDKLVRKLLSLDELEYDDENGSFKDFETKLKSISEEYGISIGEQKPTTTETKQENKETNLFKSIMKSPDLPTTTKTTMPIEKKSEEMSLVEQLANSARERNEKIIQANVPKLNPSNNSTFINSFMKPQVQSIASGKKSK